MTDQQLSKKIRDFEKKFIVWARKNKMWHDSHFSSFLENHEKEPNEGTACVSVLLTEGPIFDMLNGYALGNVIDKFDAFMENQEFWYEMYNHYTVHFYSKDDELNSHYLNYFEWQWITELIKPDYTNLYHEIFDYFKERPERFYNLHHRKFEILVSEIFKNQGFNSVLGPGRKDNGVDVKVFENNGIDQILTLVQVKKYKPSLPIKLEAVAALSGVVHTDENAQRGLFVSTSGYAPVAKKFAARKNSKITLAEASDVGAWCGTTSSLLVRDRSRLFSDDHLLAILAKPECDSLVGKILIRHRNYGRINVDFYVIVKDTIHVCLIMLLPKQVAELSDPPYRDRGTYIPVRDKRALANRVKDKVFRARKDNDSFYADDDIMSIWDGKPGYFDLND
jgi:hypothetical protein